MKLTPPLLCGFVFLFMCACQKQKPGSQASVPVTAQVPVLKPVQVNDTTYQTQFIYTHEEHYKDTSEFKIGEDLYKAYTESFSLNDSSLVEILPDSAGGRQTGVTKIKCHNHVYKIRLTKNGKQVFQKQYTKHDFMKLQEGGFIKESAPHAPRFRGVTATGEALFDILFCLPDSDFGAVAFFSTDLKGNLLKLEHCGGDCSGEIETSPDGRYFLTCENLYGPDGYVLPLLKPDVVTTAFLSDTTFVVVYNYVKRFYDQEEERWQEKYDDKTNNLLVYHVNGKKLASHRTNGFMFELGYSATIEVLKELNTVLILESEKKEIQSISISHPQTSSVIHLKDITKLKKRADNADWKEVEFWDHTGDKLYFYLAADTVKAFYQTKA